MVIDLEPEFQRVIDLAIQSGAFHSSKEVIATALSMLAGKTRVPPAARSYPAIKDRAAADPWRERLGGMNQRREQGRLAIGRRMASCPTDRIKLNRGSWTVPTRTHERVRASPSTSPAGDGIPPPGHPASRG